MKRKVLSILLCTAMSAALFTGCGKGDSSSDSAKDSADKGSELPTITFTHGYYHDESEWAAAGEMRKIYEEFAEMHKDEFNFVIKADESGAEGIYNTALNDLSAGEFYDIADFGGWDITPVASSADAILDLKPYLDDDADFKAGAGVCYDQNLTEDGKIYSVREQIEGVGFWYNEALFKEAGAAVPGDWKTWDDFNVAVDKLVAAEITPFGLNAGWPTNILLAAYNQRSADSREFYEGGTQAQKNPIRAVYPNVRAIRLFFHAGALQRQGAAVLEAFCLGAGYFERPVFQKQAVHWTQPITSIDLRILCI